VVDSRDLDEGGTIRRRRECPACGGRFTTYERVESARLVVVKRDGVREEFDRNKLASGLEKSLSASRACTRASTTSNS
jgi:transcriptional repressor NrdR